MLISEWEVKRLASYWWTYYKFPARKRALRRLFAICLNSVWFQIVNRLRGEQFWGYGWLESGNRTAMLYEFGPCFSRTHLNICSQWGFLSCRKKDPFLFVSQTEAVVFSKLGLWMNVLLTSQTWSSGPKSDFNGFVGRRGYRHKAQGIRRKAWSIEHGAWSF